MGNPYGAQTDAQMGPILALHRRDGWEAFFREKFNFIGKSSKITFSVTLWDT